MKSRVKGNAEVYTTEVPKAVQITFSILRIFQIIGSHQTNGDLLESIYIYVNSVIFKVIFTGT